MSDRPHDAAPSTAGELRQRLREMGEPWFVDPRLRDEDPLPEYQRGGQETEEPPNPITPEDDLDEIFKRRPPSNPFLRARWAESGLLSRGERQALRGTPRESPGPGGPSSEQTPGG